MWFVSLSEKECEQSHRLLQWHQKQCPYISAPWKDTYNIPAVRYAKCVTLSIPIARRLPADGQEHTKHKCTIDISSMAVPDMLFWNAKS